MVELGEVCIEHYRVPLLIHPCLPPLPSRSPGAITLSVYITLREEAQGLTASERGPHLSDPRPHLGKGPHEQEEQAESGGGGQNRPALVGQAFGGNLQIGRSRGGGGGP